MPSPTLDNTTPLSRLLNITPDYSFLRTFGCACWPSLRKYNSRKLEFRSKMCVFLGYSPMHKGYKCLDRTTGRVYISRDNSHRGDLYLYIGLHVYREGNDHKRSAFDLQGSHRSWLMNTEIQNQ
jgi:hypothetical protein